MGQTTFSGPLVSQTTVVPGAYTVATAPDAALAGVGSIIYVSDGAGGDPIIAFSDGTDFLRCDTRGAIAVT